MGLASKITLGLSIPLLVIGPYLMSGASQVQYAPDGPVDVSVESRALGSDAGQWVHAPAVAMHGAVTTESVDSVSIESTRSITIETLAGEGRSILTVSARGRQIRVWSTVDFSGLPSLGVAQDADGGSQAVFLVSMLNAESGLLAPAFPDEPHAVYEVGVFQAYDPLDEPAYLLLDWFHAYYDSNRDALISQRQQDEQRLASAPVVDSTASANDLSITYFTTPEPAASDSGVIASLMSPPMMAMSSGLSAPNPEGLNLVYDSVGGYFRVQWLAESAKSYVLQRSSRHEHLATWYTVPFVEYSDQSQTLQYHYSNPGVDTNIDIAFTVSSQAMFYRLVYETYSWTDAGDYDSDGVGNLIEAQMGWNPFSDEDIQDFDRDGMFDLWESTHSLSNTSVADALDETDGDALSTLVEYLGRSTLDLTQEDLPSAAESLPANSMIDAAITAAGGTPEVLLLTPGLGTGFAAISEPTQSFTELTVVHPNSL